MKFRRKIVSRMSYSTTNFLVVYFVVGILALLLLSVTYISYVVKRLNQSQIEQVRPLADLAAIIPSIEDKTFSQALDKIFKELWGNSRLSFIIEDKENGTIVKARGVDPVIDRKLDTSNVGVEALNPEEAKKLQKALERMKDTAAADGHGGSIPSVAYLDEGRQTIGHFYFGKVAPERMDRLPFVITDYEGNLIAWRIWKNFTKIEQASEVEIVQAEALRRQADVENRVAAIQLNPPAHQGNLYYEVAKHYELMLMPYAQMLLIGAFLAIGIVFYHNKKRHEQAAIWGGLARETAHQLGTPISALMGWIEVIGEHADTMASPSLQYIHEQMQGDIARLQKINARFGKIGTEPKRGLVDVSEIIREVALYFEKRMPSRNRQVKILLPTVKPPLILGNQELLQWVFENLIKNSLDAMDKNRGNIQFEIQVFPRKKQIVIIYSDNGRGIPRKDRKKIFLPGHTTKKHGWGLGLTLAKRIIEDYHYGTIYLTNSSPEKTTFEIRLPIAEQSHEILKGESIAG